MSRCLVKMCTVQTENKVGTIRRNMRPTPTAATAIGDCFFLLDPGALRDWFGGYDQVYLLESTIDLVSGDRVDLNLTKVQIKVGRRSQRTSPGSAGHTERRICLVLTARRHDRYPDRAVLCPDAGVPQESIDPSHGGPGTTCASTTRWHTDCISRRWDRKGAVEQRRHAMYIGLGTVLAILLIVLLFMLVTGRSA